MCFSAGASFTAGALLGTIGVVSLSKATKPSQVPFAGIPLIFGIQQLCEGFVWLSFTKPALEPWHMTLVYAFLFFAQVLWPTWLPVSITLLETDPVRKKWLRYISTCGVLVSLITGYRLLFYPVTAEMKEHHVHYIIQAPTILAVVTSALYFVATIFPGYFSGVKHMKLMASLLLGSLIISKLFYSVYLISVWCYFAAVLSVVIVYIVKHLHTTESKENNFSDSYHNKHGLEH